MTSISNKIKMLLNFYGKKQIDLLPCLGMGSKQSLNNKMARDSWSAQDLVTVADELGCKVGFILPDGSYIYLNDNRGDKEMAPGD